MLELWKKAWRVGVAPLLSNVALVELEVALEYDDPRLIQGKVCLPAWTPNAEGEEVTEVCAIGLCALAEGKKTVGQVSAFFGDLCRKAGEAIGETSGIRHFLSWFDETPRDEVRRELLAEVVREQKRRKDGSP